MSAAPSDTIAEQVGLIADEYQDRLQRGESPTIEEYAVAHPDLADVLRGVLPLISPTDRTPPLISHTVGHPKQLGEFRIIREVGRGGMGIVYEAVQEPLGRRVALKMLPAAAQLNPGYLERFQREARAAAKLHHTNIVPVFGVGESGGVHFFAMQFIEGKALDQTHLGPRASFLDVAHWGQQAAEALAYAHCQGVLHRDIKPANLLLDHAGTVWVTDFGLAKLADGDNLTGTGDFLGTLRYAAPECLRGPADERSDVYSLAATLYELLTGRPACDARERDQLVRQIVELEPPQPRRLNSSVPHDLETVVLKALAKEPSRRYQSAQELADDLRRFRGDEPVLARRLSVLGRTWRWCRRRPAVAGLLAFSMCALLALLAVTLVANRRLNLTLSQVAAERDRAEANAIAAEEARAEALTNLRRARAAVDQMLVRVADVRLQGVPRVEQVRRELLEDALRYSEEFVKEHPADPELRWEMATAYLRVGTLRELLGDRDAAADANRKGVVMLTALRAEFPDAHAYEHDLAKHYNNLGAQFRTAGRLKEAEAAYNQARVLHERLVAAFPGQLNYRLDLGKHFNNLGNVAHAQGRLSDAESSFRRGAAIAEELRTTNPADGRYRAELSYALTGLGSTLGAAGRTNEAEAALRQALALISAAAAENPRVPQYRRDILQTSTLLSYLLDTTGRTEDAAAVIRNAIQVGEHLTAEFPSVAEYRAALGRAHDRLGSLEFDRRRLTEAEASFRRALAVFEKLTADDPISPEYRQRQSSAHSNLALVYQNARRPSEAEAALKAALAIKEKLASEFPTRPAYHSELGATLSNLATLLRDRNELTEALRLVDRAIAVQSVALGTEPNHPKYREFLVKHQIARCNILLKMGDHNRAAAGAEKAAAIRSENGVDAVSAAALLAESGRIAAADERITTQERSDRKTAYHDRSITMIREGIRRGYRNSKQLDSDPSFKELRTRPEFEQIIREMTALPSVEKK